MKIPASTRGFTVVELMMAITVLAIGVTGIIAMQKITVASNLHAKKLAIATQIAHAWQDRLAIDASLWNHPSRVGGVSTPSDRPTDTIWIGALIDQGWKRPSEDFTSHQFGPAFDALGNVILDNTTTALETAYYCTHVRLTTLMPEQEGQTGLIRTEVRVFWLREGGGGSIDTGKTLCEPNTSPQAIGGAVDRYHFVYMTSAVKQNAPTI